MYDIDTDNNVGDFAAAGGLFKNDNDEESK